MQISWQNLIVVSLLVVGWGQTVRAQGDDPLVTNPDVFVIFDTSGSMTSCCGDMDCCSYADHHCRDTSRCKRSRFTAAQEVLTGTFTPSGTRYYSPGSCPRQKTDGILDIYKNLIRFGLGSFDWDKYGRYGYNTDAYGDDPGRSYRKGFGLKGRLGSDSNLDRCGSGNGCLIDVVEQDDPEDLKGNNARVQNEICSLAQKGGTPIAASLHDAKYYFENYEEEIDCKDPMGRYGGKCRSHYVLLVTDGEEWPACWEDEKPQRTPIAIPKIAPQDSDCEKCEDCPDDPWCACDTCETCPNNPWCKCETCASCPDNPWCTCGHCDRCGLNPGCEQCNDCVQGHSSNEYTLKNKCGWYGDEALQAKALYDIDVPVYVVAYGTMPEALQKRMHRIALAGSNNTSKAFIVEDASELKTAITLILDSILAGTASRTNAATTPSSTSFGQSYQYSAWFEMGVRGITWQGHLARDELADLNDDGVAEEVQERYVAAWDNYELQGTEKRASLPSPENRRFLTIIEDPRSKEFSYEATGANSMPRYENNGTKGLYPFKASDKSDGSWDFNTDLMCLYDTGEGYSDAQHARVIKAYVRGEDGITNASGLRTAEGSQLGDIFHSSPVVVGPPSALTSEYKYELYYQEYKNRHSMVYVGANDGLLHAFVAEDNDLTDGETRPLTELWAFMPPRVLGQIQAIRGGGHSYFVDATPVVRESYFHNMDSPDGDPATDTCLADGNQCVQGAWRTALVGGLRAGGDAYYALDVTEPDKPAYLWEYRTGLQPSADPFDTGNQCSGTAFQTRSEPLIGQVWLKQEADSDSPAQYINKSVVIVPGGYFPGLELSSVSSCIQLMELVVAGSTLHVLDLETGELMRKFMFGEGTDLAYIQTELDKFYTQLETKPNQPWANWQNGKAFTSANYKTDPDNGWACGEMRDSASVTPSIPAEFLQDEYCERTGESGLIAYQLRCCAQGSSQQDASKCPNFNGEKQCSYRMTKYKDGKTQIHLKTEGCGLVPKKEQGKFEVTLGSKLIIESVAATPVGYDMTADNFISRIFVVASNGKVFRVNMKNGLYDPEEAEGNKIKAYTSDDGVVRDWDASLWFDPNDSAFMDPPQSEARPVTISPALALNAERNLILYYGTGSVDNLNYSETSTDYIYAIKEVRDTDNTIKGTGELVAAMSFSPSERLFGKPLVVAGNVYFTTFAPDSDVCGLGQSRVYGLKYDDFDPDQAPMKTYVHPDPGIISAPVMRWSASGPQVVVQQGEKVVKLPDVPRLETKAFVLHWGQVM